jgi:hypothetical protein
MRDDPETDFYRAWNAGQVSRVSDGEIMKPTINNQRPWVGLTPEEVLDLFDRNNVYGSKWVEFARTVEAKLKERNSD